MGAEESQPQTDRIELLIIRHHNDRNELLASGLSAAFDCKVVTKVEYDRRKDEPEFSIIEDLDMKFYEKLCFENAKGQYGNVFGKSGKSINLYMKTLSGGKLKITAGEESFVEELKFLFEEQQGIPVDHKRLIFTFNGKKLEDGCRLSDYKIVDNSELTFMTELKASAGRVLVLKPELLMPSLDYDFKDKHDDGTVFERGGHRYQRPYGWYRYALNVSGKFENDDWLGARGIRTESTCGEWPVSFHGTKKENAEGIATKGYLLSKLRRDVYGRGIYSTPSIEVAELYAHKFMHDSHWHKIVFQNRVNSDGLKVITADEICRPDVRADYWVQTNENFIRPYGICIKEC